ncbi:hypothetical protein [Kitasatospora sp. NPDC058190]|uniref:hypothetical protein n=1 Tax=Kitasatospora sp. NPDC058190 TaxID=3346371 RepID=UPI0036DC9890
MHVHRTEHARHFTVLPNAVLQFRRLSYTARGLLADLLSRPDGWREDGRHMADTSPQGRGAVRKALKELTAAGFYRTEKVRMPDGTIRTEAHVYDTPQPMSPGTTRPVPGEATTGRAGAPVVKNPAKATTLPEGGRHTEADEARGGRKDEHRRADETSAPPDEQVREAVAALHRAIRPDPRLRLGEAEARALAPLVAQWLERGATHADLAHALLPGLPVPLHSAAAVIRHRLEHKLPPHQAPAPPAAVRPAECPTCHDPVPRPGICRPCAGLGARTPAVGGGEPFTRTGAARARTALRAARTAGLSLGKLAPIG